MFTYDAQAKRRINAAELFAVGFAFSSRDIDNTQKPFIVDGARWFVMAKSPRLAIREVLATHAAEIATTNCNVVLETVFSAQGHPISGMNAETLGHRVLYVCRAEDLPGMSVQWDTFNPGKILYGETYGPLFMSLPYPQYNGTEAKPINFRYVRAR